MISELDTIVLTKDLQKHNLSKGDVGAVVMVYNDGEAFEVEFVTLNGETIAVETINAEFVRAVNNNDIMHVRELTTV